MGRRRAGLLLGAAVAAGCVAPAQLPTDVGPSPIAVTIGALQIDLPMARGPSMLAPGPSVWVSRKTLSITVADPQSPQLLGPVVGGPNDPIGAASRRLYEEIVASAAVLGAAPHAVNLFADGRVPMTTIGAVFETLCRADVAAVHLVGGPIRDPGSTILRCRLDGGGMPSARPVTDVRIDLALTWDEIGVRASALPRPADRRPLDNGLIEPMPDTAERLLFSPELALTVADGDAALDTAAIAGLAAELCKIDDGPLGIQLAPQEMTAYAAFLGVAVAASPERRCRGPIALGSPSARERTPIRLGEVRARVLAEAARE